MGQDRRQEMQALFRRELALCKVCEGETVAVLYAGDTYREYAQAFLDAATSLGARAVEVHLPGKPSGGLKDFGKNELAKSPQAMQKLLSANMVVDLLVASFSREGDELQKAGARMLLVCEEIDALKRLFPTPEHRARTEAAMKRLSSARTLRFTNPAGSDVTYAFGSRYKPLMEYGYTAEPGRWDHWPAGLIANCAEDVNGRVVMSEGDIIYPNMTFLSEPIEFEIEKGMVRKIRGGKQAEEMRRWMEGYSDPRAFSVSHIGWGTHVAAEWSVKGIGMDGRSYYGNVLFSLGPNLEFGGDNDTACHMDLPMRGCSAWLDGEKIIGNGRILPDDMRAPGF
jgi:2,5-dihydroxypyridine 5,6-dioxygenase